MTGGLFPSSSAPFPTDEILSQSAAPQCRKAGTDGTKGADIAASAPLGRVMGMSLSADSGRPIQVYLAQPRGFCAGVVRAIEIVERTCCARSRGAHRAAAHAGHPEVEGTMGQVPGPVTLVQTVGDVKAALTLPGDTPVAYITRTTLSVDDTRDIIVALQAEFTDIQGPDIRDICYATQNRQSAVRDLSKPVDVILVVGAANSSNSNRLREIGTKAGVASYLIADGSELNPAWLRDARAVGITAGASAPEVLVDDVIEALRRIGPVTVSVLPGRDENIEFRLPAELAAS
jgi:4-hydroxy-3-methylbut-2-enyl diphosphate reductase IspH